MSRYWYKMVLNPLFEVLSYVVIGFAAIAALITMVFAYILLSLNELSEWLWNVGVYEESDNHQPLNKVQELAKEFVENLKEYAERNQ